MIFPGGHGDDAFARQDAGIHQNRRVAVHSAVVAQLAIGVFTPGHQRTIGAKRQRVAGTGNHGHDTTALQRGGSDDDLARIGGRIGNLAAGIGTPGQQRAIGGQRHIMRVTRSHGNDPVRGRQGPRCVHDDGQRTESRSIGRLLHMQLASGVIPPCYQRAVGAKCQAVPSATSHLHDCLAKQSTALPHGGGQQLGFLISYTHLSKLIGTPRGQSGVPPEQHEVIAAFSAVIPDDVVVVTSAEGEIQVRPVGEIGEAAFDRLQAAIADQRDVRRL